MDKSRIAKIGRVASNVIVTVFLILSICAVFLTLFAKRDVDGAAEIFGYQMRVVTSSSMEACEHTDVSKYEIKSIPIRSMVFIEMVPEDEKAADAWYGDLKKGDVLTFRYVYDVKQETITHRITSIKKLDTGGYEIVLEGDNKNTKDGQLKQTIYTAASYSTNYVIGKVTGQAPLIGKGLSFLKENPVALALLVILPCFVIIVFESMKIAKVVNEHKRARELAGHEQEKQAQENEIAELRRRLAELEKKDEDSQS